MNDVIVPGGINTATPYEYLATRSTRDRHHRPRNDTLVWLAEQERNHEGCCRPDSKIRP